MKIYFLNWTASYEQMMTEYLQKHYGVESIIIPKKFNRLHKKAKKIKFIINLLASWVIKKHLYMINDHDIIIYNDSHVFKGINKAILKKLKCNRVLLLRNTVKSEFVSKSSQFFDYIYTFEPLFASKVNIHYLPQFIPIGYKEKDRIIEYDNIKLKCSCFFLGRDKGRANCINHVAAKLKAEGCIIDFHIVADKTSTISSEYYIDKELSYSQSLSHTLHSSILLDIVKEGQTGMTLRILEAIYLNKKIITNNTEVLNFNFYSPSRFFIIGQDDWSGIKLFLNTPTSPVNNEILYQYSPDEMLNTLINHVIKKHRVN